MDYANGRIYKITGEGMTYYGSTTQALSKRMYCHKQLTCSSKIIMETGEAIIVLVELFPCKSKEELFSRERWFIENNECVNKLIPNRTQTEKKEKIKQWRINNKNHTNQYLIDNADKIKEYRKQYNIDNKEKKKKYYIDNKVKIDEQQKQYENDNADKIKKRKKQYYLDNKQKIDEQQKQYAIKKKEQINNL
jgi:hypothetical protein